MTVRIVLADDNALFRSGIAQILKADGRFEVVGEASRGDEAVAAASELHPDLILIDLRMPGISGVEAIRHIRRSDPQAPIGVLTIFDTDAYVKAAMDAGASGYIAKDCTPDSLCAAAAALARGERHVIAPSRPSEDLGTRSPGLPLAGLTPREVEVLRALATGLTNEAIARQLGISPKTLRNHISNTYHKLHIYDRAQAVIVAVREGLVDVNRV